MLCVRVPLGSWKAKAIWHERALTILLLQTYGGASALCQMLGKALGSVSGTVCGLSRGRGQHSYCWKASLHSLYQMHLGRNVWAMDYGCWGKSLAEIMVRRIQQLAKTSAGQLGDEALGWMGSPVSLDSCMMHPVGWCSLSVARYSCMVFAWVGQEPCHPFASLSLSHLCSWFRNMESSNY